MVFHQTSRWTSETPTSTTRSSSPFKISSIRRATPRSSRSTILRRDTETSSTNPLSSGAGNCFAASTISSPTRRLSVSSTLKASKRLPTTVPPLPPLQERFVFHSTERVTRPALTVRPTGQLAADVSHYCTEVRTSKRPFQIPAVLAIAREVAASELGKQTPRPLEEISALLGQLSQDVTTTLATAMDSEHVVKRELGVRGVDRREADCPCCVQSRTNRLGSLECRSCNRTRRSTSMRSARSSTSTRRYAILFARCEPR